MKWKEYITVYTDLHHLKTKEDAIDHYLMNGLKEKRLINIIDSDKFKELEKKIDWENYIKNSQNLNVIKTKEEVIYDYILYDNSENINILTINSKNNYFDNCFDWIYYIDKNEDLKHIKSYNKALQHYNEYGINENRLINYNQELENIKYKFNYTTIVIYV